MCAEYEYFGWTADDPSMLTVEHTGFYRLGEHAPRAQSITGKVMGRGLGIGEVIEANEALGFYAIYAFSSPKNTSPSDPALAGAI